MKILTRKNILIALLVLTVVGILVGMVCGFCLLWELTDLYMFMGNMYTIPPDAQLAGLREEAHDVVDSSIEYGLVAAFALLAAFICGVAATVLAFFIKPAATQENHLD